MAKLQLLDAGLLLEASEVEAVLGQKDFDPEAAEEGKKEKLDEKEMINKLCTHRYSYRCIN